MKKIISLALVLVMAMVALTACGVELVAPSGVYSSDSGTYRAEFANYDAKENVGDLTITFTIMDMPTTVTGKFSVAVNDPDANTFFIDFTPEGGELIESFGGYMATENAFVQLVDVAAADGTNMGGANITYNFGDATAE